MGLPQGVWVTWIHLLVLVASVKSLHRRELFDFGVQFGDQYLQPGTDITENLALDQPLIFFDDEYDSVYVNTNGFVSVKEPLSESEYLGKMPASFGLIAPFLGDLDTSDGIGKVYFRQDNNPDVLQRTAEHIGQAFPADDEIEPTHAFVVTWENVAARGVPDGRNKQRNTFQLVVASMETASYAILLYPREDLQYFSTPIEGENKPVEAGFNQGLIEGWFSWTTRQGTYYRIPSDEEDSITKLTEQTNSGRRGVWVYEIGTSPFFTSITAGQVTNLPQEEDEPEVAVPETPVRPQIPVYPPYKPEERPSIPESAPGPQPRYPDPPQPQPPRPQPRYPDPPQPQPPRPQPRYPDPPQPQPPRPQPRYPDPPQPSYPENPQPQPGRPRPQNPQVVVVDEDDLDVDVFPYNYETCSNNRQKCSIFADCRDYTNGYCCHCRPGYYGNGKDCVAEGKPQRMNGKVNGRIYVGNSPSPVEFSSNDLHSYVVANDGRAYVAISAIPGSVGPSLQPLASLGGAIGWAFALEQPGHENGFSIIGGVFTRQAEVTFLPGNEKLTVKQQFSGIDEHDHLVIDTELEGRIPEVPRGATVQIEPYSEIYQYSNNLITSSSTRDYTVSLLDGSIQTRTYQWRQTIVFQSCPHDEASLSTPPSQQLSVDQVFVMYDAGNQLIRFALSNKIGSIQGGTPDQNPCFTGRHGCDTNAVCRAGEGTQHTCECASGFNGDGRTCYDIDECAENPRICGAHAICNNQPGTFRCECMDGFQFASDGRTCVEVSHAVDHCRRGSHGCDIPERASCSYTGGSNYICSCLPGYTGDGRTCRDIDECQSSRCHRDATCYNTPGSFTCQCRSGFHGDGFSCSQESEREKTQCERHRDSAQAATSSSGYFFFRPRPAVGQYVPTCDAYGAYEPTQCHGSTGHCWCVDRDGQELSGTRTGPGSRPMCFDHGVAPPAIGPTPRPGVTPLAPGTSILFAQSGKIDHIPLDDNNMKKDEAKTLLHLPDKVVIAVAYDCVERMVYWSDITSPSISRASMRGGQPSVIISDNVGSPEGIAIDHLSRIMFWTDSILDRIEVSSLDGRHRRVLFDDDLVNPRPIVADPVAGRLYWADWNRDSPKIETSNMDGTERNILVKDNIGLPNGLTYEPQDRQLCWADAGTRRIECMDPYSRQRRKISEGLQYPFAIVASGRNLYYTDWRRDAVVAVDRFGEREVDEFLPQKRSRTYGIATSTRQCPQGVNYCSRDNGGCSHLCLPRVGGFTCRCPDNQDGTCVDRDRNF